MFFSLRNWNVKILKGGFLDVFSGFPFSKAFAASMFVDFQGRGLVEVFQQRIVGSKAPFCCTSRGEGSGNFPRLFVCLGFFEKELSNEKKT